MAASPPRAEPSLRLVPSLAASRARRHGLPLAAVVVAVALHLVLGTAVILRPPAFLAAAAKAARRNQAPRMAAVELVQNAMPTTGDQPAGGSGKTIMHHDAVPPHPPLQATTRQARQGLEGVPQGRNAMVSAGIPKPDGQGQPAAQARQAARQPHTDVRLDDSGDDAGLSGGDADKPSAPDPNAHNRLPPYPVEAARNGEQGTVVAMVRVKPDGTPAAVIVVQSSGWPALDTSVVSTLRHWKFRPGLDHGVPVESQVPVSMDFVN
jgi:TonB family protein